MEKCGAHSCSDRFLKAGLIALLALLLCGAAVGAVGAAEQAGSWTGDLFTPDPDGYTSAANLVADLNKTGTDSTSHAGTAEESPSGTVKLLKDVKLGGTLKIGGDEEDSFVLDLGGKVLSADSTKGNFSVITVDDGKYLKVIDSVSSTPHYFKYVINDAWTYAGDTEPADKYKVFILNGTGDDKFTREAADTAADEAPEGKSVYIKVTGGCITGGTGTDVPDIGIVGGGGVLCLFGTFTMHNNASIIGNSTMGDGGGVLCLFGTFTMHNNASIIGNSAMGDGGGVLNAETFTMYDNASIIGNSAMGDGGGVKNYGPFTMYDNASIIGNSAACDYGGGVFIINQDTFNVRGTPVIKGNIANGETNNVDDGGEGNLITLTGPLTDGAEIHITSPAAAGKFGKVDASYTSPTQTDADHFVSDSTDPVLAAVLDGGSSPKQLDWAAAEKIEITQPTGGKISSLPLSAAITGFDVSLTAIPDAGYVFDKWDVKKADGTSVEVTEDKFTMKESAVTVTATFKKSVPPTPVPPTTATVTFNVQGHGTAPASQTVDAGSTITRPADPSTVGYTFGGWYTNSGCAEDTKWNFDTPVNSDMTLYAKWTIAYYAAKIGDYTYAGGIIPVPYLLPEDLPDAMYFYSATANGPVTPWTDITTTTLDAGTWYIGAEAPGHPEAVILRSTFTVEKAPRTAPEFTATEKDGEITLTLSIFSSSETYMYCIKEAGEEDKWIPVTKRTTTIAGLKTGTDYEIKVKINAKGNYGESISAPKTVKTGSTFSVTYNANGGVGTIEPQTGTAGESVTVESPAGKITREGYDFVDWTDSAGTHYNPGDSVSEGVTLYAQWKPQTYTITFNGNGGTVSKSHLQPKYGEPVALSEITASRDGYTHTGWAVSSTGSAVYAPGQEVQNLGDITLYAVWTPTDNVYTVTVTSDKEQTQIELKQGSFTICYGRIEEYRIMFPGVPEGTYTLVATKDGKTVTRTETITGDAEIDVTFPEEDVSSEVEISTENATPAVAVGGVDKAAEGAAEFGKSVTVKVTVEAKVEGTASPEEQQTQIEIERIKEKATPDTELQYLGITVEKTISGEDPEPLTSTANLLEFIIPYDFTNKDQVKLYRCHDGSAKPLTEIKSKDDKYDGTYLLDEENGRIFLYADKFSTYSIGYVPISPKPSHKSSSQGSSVWLTETPEPTVTPTPTAEPTQGPTQGVPTVKPTDTQTPASPMPIMGILAGLGCAAVFGLRRR